MSIGKFAQPYSDLLGSTYVSNSNMAASEPKQCEILDLTLRIRLEKVPEGRNCLVLKFLAVKRLALDEERLLSIARYILCLQTRNCGNPASKTRKKATKDQARRKQAA